MTDLSRRTFLAGSAGVAAGASVFAGVATATGGSGASTATYPDDGSAALADGVVVYVRDAGAGEVLVMADQASAQVTDPALVAAIGRALAGAGS